MKKLSRRRHGAKTYKKVLHDEILTKINKTNAINSYLTLQGLIITNNIIKKEQLNMNYFKVKTST